MSIEPKKSKNPFIAATQKLNGPAKITAQKPPKAPKGFSKPPMRTAGRGR